MQLNKYEQQFGENLQYYRRRKNLTQQELGERIGIGHSSISLWEKGERSPSVTQLYQLCRALACSPDDLLNQRTESYSEKGANLEWLTTFPASASLNFRENILDGIHLFQFVAASGLDYTQITQRETYASLSPFHLWNKINAALQSGAIELVDVERDLQREKALKEKYQLLHCFVARLDGLVEDNIADLPVRSEAISFLAAKYCLPLIRGFESVGLSGGPPVVRFFDLIPPLCPDIAGITWRALLSTKRQISIAPMGGSANGIISRLLYNQPHTRGFSMPFINLDRRDPDYHHTSSGEERQELDYANATRRSAAYVQACFLCLGSPDSDYKNLATETANPELLSLYDQLPDSEKKRCQGDVLLRLLDSEGRQVGSAAEQRANEALVYSIDLDDLRSMVRSKKQVWVLSEIRQKAGIIRAALASGLTNCLVIDNGIADELLKNPQSTS